MIKDSSNSLIMIRVFNCAISPFIAYALFTNEKTEKYMEIYKSGFLIEDIVWILVSLTFFDPLIYLIDPIYLFKRRHRFCCLKKTSDGRVINMAQIELNK